MNESQFLSGIFLKWCQFFFPFFFMFQRWGGVISEQHTCPSLSKSEMTCCSSQATGLQVFFHSSSYCFYTQAALTRVRFHCITWINTLQSHAAVWLSVHSGLWPHGATLAETLISQPWPPFPPVYLWLVGLFVFARLSPLSSAAALLFFTFLFFWQMQATEFRPCTPRGNLKVAASHKPVGLCRSSFCCSLGRRFFRIATANTPQPPSHRHTHSHRTPPSSAPPTQLPSSQFVAF